MTMYRRMVDSKVTGDADAITAFHMAVNTLIWTH